MISPLSCEGDFDPERAFAGGGWTNDRDDWIRLHAEVSRSR